MSAQSSVGGRWRLWGAALALVFGVLVGLSFFTFTYAEGLSYLEEALLDAIVTARNAGATDEQLAAAWALHRAGQLRWDFISSENSTGFHAPQESARVLADSIDLARQAQLAAVQLLNELQPGATTFNP